jgi:hypothetical protein
MISLARALIITVAVLFVLAHPAWLLLVIPAGCVVAFLTAGVGLWRILWFGGRRAKERDR